jgi:hypothetical protein
MTRAIDYVKVDSLYTFLAKHKAQTLPSVGTHFGPGFSRAFLWLSREEEGI